VVNFSMAVLVTFLFVFLALKPVVVVFSQPGSGGFYEGWKFNSGNYLFTTDTK